MTLDGHILSEREDHQLRAHWIGRFAESHMKLQNVQVSWYANEEDARSAVRFLAEENFTLTAMVARGTKVKFQRNKNFIFKQDIVYDISLQMEDGRYRVDIKKDSTPLLQFSYTPDFS